MNNLDRKALYDSAGRLVKEQFFRDGNIYRNIVYRGNVGIIEDSMSSDGIRVQTVKRMDLYPGFLLMSASNEKDRHWNLWKSTIHYKIYIFSANMKRQKVIL